MAESVINKLKAKATISRYVIKLNVDPHEVLQACSSLGNQLLSGPVEEAELLFHTACCQIVQEMLGEENMLLWEQLRIQIRVMYLPSAFQECHLHSIASALEISREDIAEGQDAYSGFLTMAGRVSKIFLAEYIIYSQTFICTNPKCYNRNCLHFTPSATRKRVIKRTEDDGFMETGSSATLLPIDLICSHCNMEMPESVIDRVYTEQQKIVLDCLNAARAEGCFVNQIEATLKGESIQLLGRLSRSMVQKAEGTYLHGIRVEVNNVLKVSSPEDIGVPKPIESILRSNMSPWNTSQAIVDLLDYITPGNAYRKLKLALLLSAVSIEDRDCTLDKEAGNVYWDHGPDASRQSLYTIHQTRKAFTGCINAEVLCAARKGILLLDLNLLDKKSTQCLSACMDRDDIYVQCEDNKLSMDVRCCCWSLHTNASSNSAALNIDGAPPGEMNTKPAEPAPLVELFDLVIAQAESNAASDISQAIATHTMRRHMSDHSDKPGALLSRMAFSSYIRSASNIHCEDLLKAYFQVMRKKGSALDTNEFSSVAVMSTLLNLAACHAKLCFREVSEAGDALVSIMMVEETMAARFDGKENIGLLYGAHWSPDSVFHTVQGQEELTVPVVGLQEYDCDVNEPLPDAGGSVNIEEARDRCMERMYAHLMQVIAERSNAPHITALEL
ncbi:Minichromosome maintenance domain-containing protein 2 [Mortierella alpina]|nr:Minichromosome maintenance domain-containing protein 2 [Mortierella alpina]